MSIVVALFLLSQVFLIVSHGPLVHTLAAVMLLSDLETIQTGASKVLEIYGAVLLNQSLAFSPPKESLEKSLENLNESLTVSEEICVEETSLHERKDNTENEIEASEVNHPSTSFDTSSTADTPGVMSPEQLDISIPAEDLEEIKHLNVTDEEKEQRMALESPLVPETQKNVTGSLSNKPFLETILNSLSCSENDYAALFALCLLYALASNQVGTENLKILAHLWRFRNTFADVAICFRV